MIMQSLPGGIIKIIPVLRIQIKAECIDDIADALFVHGANERKSTEFDEPGHRY